MSKFSEQLKRIRNNRGISQEELAKVLGVSRSRIGMYETGDREPNFEMLEAIADYFNISMSDLIDENTPKEAPIAFPSNGQLSEATSLFNHLSAEKKRHALDYLRFLAAFSGKK